MESSQDLAPVVSTDGTVPAGPDLSIGGKLREAREAAGWSVDDVAKQIKLHPRQVDAIERNAFHELPGSTFVRGFIRSYAKAVQLDAGPLLDQLTDNVAAPAIKRISPTVAELPVDRGARSQWQRLAIPVFLGLIIAALAYFEWRRQESNRATVAAPAVTDSTAAAGTRESAATPPAEPPLTATGPTTKPDTTAGAASVLPSQTKVPVAPPEAQTTPSVSVSPPSVGNQVVLPTPSGVRMDSAAVANPAPVTGSPARPLPGSVPANNAPAAMPTHPVPPPSATATARGNEVLRLSFSGKSWVEVRDGNGKIIHSQINNPGTVQEVGGVAPLSVTIGNAPGVTLSYRGQPVDLAPHTRKDVARLSLQ